MAERRMFTKKITNSDAFIDMPLSTQALYFHLNMEADDDGFNSSPKKVQRMIGASDDDLKLLILKKFIIPFESGIVVIKHWRMHNYIQKDRYKETVYLEEKQQLEVKDNKSYTLMDTPCIQNGYKMDTQVRLGKDSIDKNSIEYNMPEAEAPDSSVIENHIIDLPTNRFNTIKECYYVTEDFYQTMVELYPNTDVLEEMKKMKAWLLTNKTKRKTLKGMEKFINSWLGRQQDSFSKNYNQSNNKDLSYQKRLEAAERLGL